MKATTAKALALRYLMVSLVMLFSFQGYSQTNAGKDFWVAQTPNLVIARTDTAKFGIYIANMNNIPATITITNASRPTITATLAAGALQSFTFATENRNIQATGTYVNNVYRITSDQNVVVYSFDPLYNVITNDASLVLPKHALGKRYMAASFFNPAGGTFNTFYSFIGSENGTNIKVYDHAGVLQDDVNLNTGEYYQRVNPNTIDVTGWYIEASHPVAVLTGNQASSVGSSSGASDHLVEQIVPIETLAKTYVASPTNSRPVGCTVCTQDVFRYIATEDNTVITTSPNVGGGTLNKGQFIQISTNVPHVVRGSKPFYGFQYLGSQNSGTPAAGTGDPSLIAMPLLDQLQFRYTFVVPTSYPFNFINVMTEAGANLSLNGQLINPLWKTADTVNGKMYQSATLPVQPGVHNISGDRKFGIVVSGFGTAASFAYMGGHGLQQINAGCVSGGPYQALTCGNKPVSIQLNATPSCDNGSTPLIEWSSSDGITFNDPNIANAVATAPGVGTFYISLKVTCGGNTIICETEIIIREPLVGCANITQPVLRAPEKVIIPADSGKNNASNVSLGNPTYTATQPISIINSGTITYPNGTSTVTWTLTDGNGISVSDTQQVVVIPAPVIAAPPSVTLTNDNGMPYATNLLQDTATYTSGWGPNILSHDAPVKFSVGVNTVTWTVKDGFNRTASATQLVTVVSAAPTITAPPTITVTAGYNGFATVNDLKVNGNETVTVSVNPSTVTNNNSSTLYAIGTTNITWTVTDGINRTASDVQQVIVLAPLPKLNPLADVIVSNNPGVNYATVTLVPPTYDAIGPVTLTNNAPAQFPLGETIVTWTLTDKYGKTTTVTQKVTVMSAPPTIVAPASITVTAAAGQSSAAIANIGNAAYTVSVNPANLSSNAPVNGVFPIGTTTVIWTVQDGLGRTATATQTITVNAPVTCSFLTSVVSIPTDNTPTGGNPNNLYIGYGAQSTKLQVNVPNTGGPYTFQWSGDGLNSYTSAAPVFTPGNKPGTYNCTVNVRNSNGCTSTATISICVRDVRSLDKNGNWDGKKVIVCHLPPGNPANVQYIDVSINAVPAHVPLHGGDGLGSTCVQKSCTSPYARGAAPVTEVFGVSVYPNPSAGVFALTVKSDDKYTDINIRIIDAFGRTVEVMNNVTAGRTVVFGDRYANGAYYAEVVQGSDKKILPLVKTK